MYHRNQFKIGNDFIFVSKKLDETNSLESIKILDPFMNMISIDKTCANEIITYLDEPDNPEEALCSKFKDYYSSYQGKDFFEP